MTRAEYETCIGKYPSFKISLCDRDVSSEFHFSSIDHAFANWERFGRCTTCKKCLKVIREWVKNEKN